MESETVALYTAVGTGLTALGTLALALFGLRQTGIQTRSLKLMERGAARSELSPTLAVHDHRIDRTDDGGAIMVRLTVTNPSDLETTVVDARLATTFQIDGGTRHELTTRPAACSDERSPFSLPLAIGRRDARTGWLCFPESEALAGTTVESRELRVSLSNGMLLSEVLGFLVPGG